ncbi:MAG: metal-dependent hydrolase [Vicinamibacterales bacterium]
MPSPVGHALGGAVVAALALQEPLSGATWASRARAALAHPLVRLAAVAACLPDLDFLWGRHNMETHSLGAALLAGAAVWAWGRRPGPALVVAAAWMTHVAFDWLGSDDTAPLGVMALWPFDDRFHFAHAYVFEAISRRYWLPGFAAHNLWAVTTEVLMLAPLFGAIVAARARRPHHG